MRLLPLFLMGLLLFAWTTYFTFEPFGEELRSKAYDSLGDSLLKAEVSVEPDSIGWEGLDIGGKKYIYQGPFPALLRIVPNLLWPEYKGKWGRLSCFLAGLLVVIALSKLLDTFYKLSPAKDFPFAKELLLLSAVLGTPLVHLSACSYIYHEAIIWGLCASTWGLFFLTQYFFNEPKRFFFFACLGCAASVALLSRITFGLPMYAIWCLCGIHLLRTEWKTTPSSLTYSARRSLRGFFEGLANFLRNTSLGRLIKFSSCALGGAFGLLIQACYNRMRFGSIFQFFDYQSFYLNSAELGGEFTLLRWPSTFYNYFGLRLESFSEHFPYLSLAPVLYSNAELFFSWREQTASFLLTSPLLLLLGFAGSLQLLRTKSLLMPTAGFLLLSQGLLILSYFFVTQRYAAEFLPFFYYTMAFSLPLLLQIKSRFLKTSIGLASLWSLIATTASTLSWLLYFSEPGTDLPTEVQTRYANVFLPALESPILNPDKEVFLNQLPVREMSADFALPQLAHSWNGSDLLYRGRKAAQGIGLHASARITFELPAKAMKLNMTVALADTAFRCPKAASQLLVLDEQGRTLWRSQALGMPGALLENEGTLLEAFSVAQEAEVALGGAKALTIIADPLGSRDCDHLVIINPIVRFDS